MLAQLDQRREPLIVGSILLYADEFVKTFVAARIPHMQGGTFAPHDTGYGVIRNGKFVGGVVFHEYNGPTMFMSGAFDLLTATGRKNERARKIDKGLGFKEIGIVRHYWGKGQDAVLMQLPRSDCRWLKDI
jgi:hypothetical protein